MSHLSYEQRYTIDILLQAGESKSAICQRFEFENVEDFTKTMNRFRIFYNFNRIHGGLGYTSPARFLEKHGVIMKRKIA